MAVWVAQVGRVPALLLDTDINENDEADRPISHILYVRGREMRLHQELVLGVGGVRAIRALGIKPAAWHLNEGHSAFLLAERARELVAAGRTSRGRPSSRSGATSVFTIHTPVSAGNERFDADLVRRSPGTGPRRRSDRRRPASSTSSASSSSAGAVDDDPRQFDMTALSLRLSSGANAVSQLHAATANATWSPMLGDAADPGDHQRRPCPDLGRDRDERPVREHPRRRPRRPRPAHASPAGSGSASAEISDRDLWAAHQRQKSELAIFARKRLRSQFARHGEAPIVLEQLEEVLDPEILTIGFARRFATYKRAGLLFTDVERLARLLWHPDRPVQIVFAGKAHPADRPGQGVIQQIFERSRSAGLRGRVFILEDYDMRIARFLVQGVDVWLNNPRRPLEASGTSGMKAAHNGVINASVLDGWWDEGWTGDNGWAIGGREQNPDEGAQDWADALDLYRILEDEIVPRYYERGPSGVPTGWTERMRASIASTIWRFSTTRMLHEYTEQLYLPAAGVTVVEPVARSRLSGVPHRIALALAIHNHQPVGNFGWVIGQVYEQAYRPMLEAIERHPGGQPLAALLRARCSTGSRREQPGLPGPARALVGPGGSSCSAAATTSRSWPRCPSATALASSFGWPTSSSGSPGSGRAAPGWPSGSGSRTCPAPSVGAATTGRSSTTPTSARPRSPRPACGAPTPPMTRATC